jgi:hypothetical protein
MVLLATLVAIHPASSQEARPVQVRTPKGIVEGSVGADDAVRSFQGIPFAAPA